MGEKHEYVWLIPLIGGILAIISVLTPVAYFSSGGLYWIWWMWSFSVIGGMGYGFENVIISEMDFMIPSSIITSVMIISIISFLSLAIITKKRKLNTRYFELVLIIIGVLLIGITLYYLFAIDSAFYDGLVVEGILFPPGFHFWEELDPSFGVIGPFLSAISAFIGAGVFRYYSNRRVDLMPPKMGIYEKKRTITKTIGGFNFCPECGQKIISEAQHFCMNCGFELQNI